MSRCRGSVVWCVWEAELDERARLMGASRDRGSSSGQQSEDARRQATARAPSHTPNKHAPHEYWSTRSIDPRSSDHSTPTPARSAIESADQQSHQASKQGGGRARARALLASVSLSLAVPNGAHHDGRIGTVAPGVAPPVPPRHERPAAARCSVGGVGVGVGAAGSRARALPAARAHAQPQPPLPRYHPLPLLPDDSNSSHRARTHAFKQQRLVPPHRSFVPLHTPAGARRRTAEPQQPWRRSRAARTTSTASRSAGAAEW